MRALTRKKKGVRFSFLGSSVYIWSCKGRSLREICPVIIAIVETRSETIDGKMQWQDVLNTHLDDRRESIGTLYNSVIKQMIIC